MHKINNYLWMGVKILFALLLIVVMFKFIMFMLFPFGVFYHGNITSFITMLSNVFMAIFAGSALKTWKNQIDYKNFLDIRDDILKIILAKQKQLEYDFEHMAIGLQVDENNKKQNETDISKKAKQTGLELELLSSKCKSANKYSLSKKLYNLSQLFQEFVKIKSNQYEFYTAYYQNQDNFRDKIKNGLSEIKDICEKPLDVIK